MGAVAGDRDTRDDMRARLRKERERMRREPAPLAQESAIEPRLLEDASLAYVTLQRDGEFTVVKAAT
jgi:hypothetical protein